MLLYVKIAQVLYIYTHIFPGEKIQKPSQNMPLCSQKKLHSLSNYETYFATFHDKSKSSDPVPGFKSCRQRKKKETE